ncbi:glycosyltransferase family 39 protein [candidate division KSB1 bacterium]|nr:glycosyltransferase family 39 protein [candidate division KSB1 bacterium]
MNQSIVKIFNHQIKAQKIFIALLIIFFILELILFSKHTWPLLKEESDGIGFMMRATGPVFQEQRQGPGYSLAIRLLNFTGMDLYTSAKAVSLIFGIVLIYAVWKLIMTVSSKPHLSLFAVFLFIFHPAIITGSVMIMSDIMAAALFFTCLILILSHEKLKAGHFLLAGIAAGAAYLTRSIYIVLLALPVLHGFLIPGKNKLQNKIFHAALYLAGFILISIPWFIYLHQTKGNPLWTMNHLNIAFKMFENGRDWNVFPTQDQYGSVFNLFASSPMLFIKSWAKTLLSFPAELIKLFPVFGVFAVFGFFYWISKLENKKIILLVILGLYGALVSLVWLNERFLLIFIPLTAVFIVTGLSAIPPFISVQFKKRNLVLPLTFLVYSVSLLLFSGFVVKSIPQFLGNQPLEYQKAALWLKQNAQQGEKVLAAKPHIPFFSDTECLFFRMYKIQDTNLETLSTVLQEVNPDYIIFDERYSAKEFPQLKTLADPQNNPLKSELREVFYTQSPQKLVIYRYNKKNSEKSDFSQDNN